ncbi:universal stress protein [Rhodococcus wratislaviensis]|uniref:Universal stress protein n=1 Tax=Rhodococcus wratislaviensis TaxID=44752 RepID=A0AB38F4E5_RHOWR|nr:universal stress protein [Rhodococcus wratislaviensis]SPZ34088.1 universal stress protein [Rhodococcus wratislaviensis]
MRAAVWARSLGGSLCHCDWLTSCRVRDTTTAKPLSSSRTSSPRKILDRAERRVKSAFPDITVSCSTHPGPAGPALAGSSAHAEIVVVGSTGAGALESLLTGSTVLQVVNRAHCPVTVFRSEATPSVPDHRPVVVGVDGSDLSSLAIRHGCRVRNVLRGPAPRGARLGCRGHFRAPCRPDDGELGRRRGRTLRSDGGKSRWLAREVPGSTPDDRHRTGRSGS